MSYISYDNSSMLDLNLSSTTEQRLNFLERYDNDEYKFLVTHRGTILAASRLFPPVWWIVGFIGNIIALIVWLQPKMRHSSGYYLAALAISDLLFLPLNIVFEINFAHGTSLLDKAVLCEWFAVVYLSVQYMSPVLVLAFTVERYLSVCHPFRMVNFNQSNSRCTLIVILLLMFACFALNAVQGYFWTTSEKDICDLRAVLWEGPAWTIWTWTVEMIVFGLVPITVLVLNILVIREVKNISKLEQRNMRTNSIDRRSTTFMLVGVSFYQIITVLPVTIGYALYNQFPTGDVYMTDEEVALDPTWQRFLDFTIVRIFLNNIGQSHYAANFFIYMLTGKIFRKQLRELIVIYCCKEKIGKYLQTKTTHTRTTRMSLSSHRGCTVKNHNGHHSYRTPDQCNNDMEALNKNSIYISSEMEETSVAPSGRYTTRNGSMQAQRLLTCVEESDGDISDKEEADIPLTPIDKVESSPSQYDTTMEASS